MDPDPWNWSVQDVQQFFRNDAARYIADMPHSRFPQLEPFLKALNDNDVDGAVLLTTIDPASLRDDCGIAKLGERGAVLHCISKLRKQSSIHLNRNDPFGLQTPPSLPYLALPAPSTVQNAVVQSTEPVENSAGAEKHARSGEVHVEDSRGRKRRKLDLSKVQTSDIPEEPLEDVDTSSPITDYFGKKAFPIDDIFFGSTKFGQEIRDFRLKGNVRVASSDEDSDLREDNFQFFNQNESVGHARYVYSRVRYFLCIDKEINTRRRQRDAIGFLPYRDNLGLDAPSATVVQFPRTGQEPIALRENAKFLKGGFELDEPTEQSPGENDYLLEKYKPTEDVLDIFGEDEIDFGDQESQAATVAGDAEPEAEEDTDDEDLDLSLDAAGEIFDRFVADCITKWQDNLPRLEKDRAWSVWKKMKQSHTLREGLIRGAGANIERFTKRLDTMKSRLLSEAWQDVEKLQSSCRVLEPTIEDREEQKWKITVWRRRQEPAHVPRHGTHANKSASHTPATGRKDTGLVVDPYDRFSLSPGPVLNGEDNEGRPDENANGVINLDEEIQYDADDEVYHTPRHSPSLSHAAEPFVVDTQEEVDVDTNADADGTKDVLQEVLSINTPADLKEGTEDQDYAPNVDGESESELPSPSTFVPKRIPRTLIKPEIQPIDLTGLSDSSSPQKPGRKPKHPGKKPRGSNENPMDAAVADVKSWEWHTLVSDTDRTRILIKLLSEKNAKFRDRLDALLRPSNRAIFQKQLASALLSRKNGSNDPDLQAETADTMMPTAEMYIRWAVPAIVEQGVGMLSKDDWKNISDFAQYGLFTSLLMAILKRKASKLFVAPEPKSTNLGSSSVPILLSSEDSEGLGRHATKETKKRRPVKRNEDALDTRQMALERQKRYAEVESQTTNSVQLAAMIASDPDHYSTVAINPAKKAEHDSIYISDRIARQMKPHQIDGTRFLWREITAEGDDEGWQGCILAHTMGLGKTMQTIALLVALNEAALSDQYSIYKQLPGPLRKKVRKEERQVRVLVLCPPSLMQNWRREIEKWAPNRLGNIIVLDTSNKSSHLGLLREWERLGGVLLAGYEMFRSTLAPPKPEKKNQKSPEEAAEFEKILLKRPEIVIADEAHNIKNEDSGISIAASRFATESRIALTGTPMSNDVQEIYALVSWVAPNFLGDRKEFNGIFAIPIKEGLYAESNASARRRSFKLLKVLHAEIEPKINRANIEVLRGVLPSKIEYFITLALTPRQEEIYRKYIELLRTENAAQVTIFAWLGDLLLLANHPHCLRQKLLAAPLRKAKKPKRDSTEPGATSREQTPASGGESGSITPLRAGLITDTDFIGEDGVAIGFEESEGPSLDATQSQQIINEIEDNMDPQLSVKVPLFLQLLNYSLDLKDKVLVFSSSIPTLDYLGKLLERNGKRFARIDGHTPMSRRDVILERFHSKKRDDTFEIMLVSTRAGGVGLNIQGANRVFIFDFKFNPSVEEQAIGRAYRLGQTKPVFVYRFVTGGSFEQDIYNQQLFKTALTARVVDKKNPGRKAERKPSDYLYEPKVVPQRSLAGKADRDPHVLGRLLLQHGPAEEGKIDTMIREINPIEVLQEEEPDAPLNEEEQREVNDLIELNRRHRGKKSGLPASSQAAMHPRVQNGPPYVNTGARVADSRGMIPPYPIGTQPNPSRIVALPLASMLQQQVPSTMPAGPTSNPGNTHSHPMGGLPFPSGSQPY